MPKLSLPLLLSVGKSRALSGLALLHDPLLGAVSSRQAKVLQRQLLTFGTGVKHQFAVSTIVMMVMAWLFPSPYGMGIKMLWLTLTIAVLALRLVLGLRYAQMPLSLSDVYRVEHLALGVIGMNALVYGWGIWVLYSPDPRLMNLLVTFSFGMLAGGAMTLMALPRVMWLYIVVLTVMIFVCLRFYAGTYVGSPGSIGVLLFAGLTAVVFHRGAKLQIITEALSLEKETLIAELHTQVARAEQANTEKTQFLTAVSHDVRQPAHALLLLSRTVLRQMEQLTHAQPVQTTARHLHSAAQELHTMLDGLVDVARLQAGALKPKCQTVELDLVLQRVHSLFASIAEHREQVLRVRLNGSTVWADPELLFRMICNLVDNALKFSPPDACVWVGARRSGEQWRLEVRDSGPGIPPEAQERVFAAFVQLHHGPNRVAGIGYGLTVVRQFARLQKLRLGLRSCPMHGSCFWIELPTAEDPSLKTQPLMIASPTKGPSFHAHVRPILLLDDDIHTREATAAWLQTAGFQVQAHANEAAALLALSRGATGLNEAGAIQAPYALAILDINLAQGLNTDALLVLLCQFHPPVPCIIVSAGPKPRDLPKEVMVFSKPVDADVLLEAVERLCLPQGNAQRKL